MRASSTLALALCTKIPLDTPLAQLVTADPAIDVTERDLGRPHVWNWLTLKIRGWCHI
jgi:hypothetical protein